MSAFPIESRLAASQENDRAYDGWLMYHSVGVFPRQRDLIDAALTRFSADWCAPDDRRWDCALEGRQTLLRLWARLINAGVENVFATSNVTEAFARFLDALGDLRLRGRSVLIAADCFPSLHFLLSGLAQRYGFTLRTVPLREGEAYVHDEDFIAQWDADVALALVTWVSSLTSKRADLAALASHARGTGSLIAVDITQGAGILPFDLCRIPFDFVCATTLKWLCGVPGSGLAYVAPGLLEEGLSPAVRGWFSQPNPFNWDINGFAYADDARRFDTGTPSPLPFIASVPGFEWVLSQPPGELRAHNLKLCHRIIEIVEENGFRLLSPREDEQRGGSIMAQVPATLDVSDIVARLAKARVAVDARGSTLRMSPGNRTTWEGIERLATCLGR